MRKNYFFVIFLISLKLLAQEHEPDITFNNKETRVFQQDIGISGAALPNKKLLTVYKNSSNYNVLLLNEDGNVDKNFNTIDSYSVNSFDLYAKSDGKFLTLDSYKKLKAFNADGTLNSDFKTVQLTTTSQDAIVIKDIIYQDDGKIIISGFFNGLNSSYTGSFVRLNADGSIDTTFKPEYTSVNDVKLQSDGKYVVAIRSASGVARLLANGKLDTTFKVYVTRDPKMNFVTNGFETENNSIISNLVVQPDGKIIAVGCNFKEGGRAISYNIARLNSNGSRDTAFKLFDSATPTIEQVYLQKDSKIIIEINRNSFIRLNPDGTEDISFKYLNKVGLVNSGELFLQGDKMIISSHYKDAKGITRKGIHRINNDGSIDLTFNPHAGFNLLFDQWEYYRQYALVSKVLLDQKILVAGDFSTYNDTPVRNLCRLEQNGLLDTNFKLDPAVNISGTSDNGFTILQQKDGKIVILHEKSISVNGVNKSIIRLNTNGSIDNSFNCTVNEGYIKGIKLMSDGRFLLMGTRDMFVNSGNYKTYNLIRLNTDGSIDNNFKVVFNHQPYMFHSLADDNFIITFLRDNSYYPYDIALKINKDGITDKSFKVNYLGYNKVKPLNNGKILISDGDALSRINADGSTDPTFTPYKFRTSKVDNYDFYENGTINLLVSSYETNTTKRIILSSEGTLLNTITYNTAGSYEIQNCEDVILYGYFTKIKDENIHSITRYKYSNSESVANPSGEIYQEFNNGQTLQDLKIGGDNIKWYTAQSNCGINGKLTNKANSEEVLPLSTFLVNGTTYYASQTINNIESSYRLPVTVYSASLGVKENELPNLVSYPNPVRDFYTISNNENITKIEIYNILGQIQYRNTYDKNNVEIDFTTLQSGLYFAKIYVAEKSAIVKIVKY
ncbi:T9SS type A sorting domain-containing protein [Flavobacterium notoginsengisoli]|uniref:T9SS type A sorting domain-containing protein n=1 Tax=Flavobacterium notoginsengisoli TaxID=1478199 RepID=UPI003641F34C